MKSIADRRAGGGGAEPGPVQETLAQALARPRERRVFTHDGCGGWVLFDLAGGQCLSCGARPLRAAEYSKPRGAA